MKKVRHWVQETIESGRFVETGAMSEGGAEIYAKHVEQAEILDCSEHEIAYARISDKYKTAQRDLNTAKALIADIKEFDVESFLILPHELRKRMQALLDS